MHQAPLIVCERTGDWAVAWRREAAGASSGPGWSGCGGAARGAIRLIETRSTAECREVLGNWPAGFVAAELTAAHSHEVLALLAAVWRDFPAARAAVLAARGMEEYEWLARELGAVHVVTSPRRVASLIPIVSRHLDSLPPPELSLTERIWASLPWAD